jgi:hypothetical protein
VVEEAKKRRSHLKSKEKKVRKKAVDELISATKGA